MPDGLRLLVFPTTDLARQTALLRSLSGTDPYVEGPWYVGFRVGEVELGIDPRGHRDFGPGPVCYWEVDDLEAAVSRLEAAGAEVRQPAKDVGGGMRTAVMVDGDGNVIGLRAG